MSSAFLSKAGALTFWSSNSCTRPELVIALMTGRKESLKQQFDALVSSKGKDAALKDWQACEPRRESD